MQTEGTHMTFEQRPEEIRSVDIWRRVFQAEGRAWAKAPHRG